MLDLDETLVHTTDKAIPQYDCRVEIHTKKAHRVFYILKRPFLDVFLVTLSQYFEIVIFTASIRRYADAVIDLIDLHHVVDRRFFRQVPNEHTRATKHPDTPLASTMPSDLFSFFSHV